MKKALSLLMFLVLFSCSTPTWNNMSETDIASWKELNIDIETANSLNEIGVSPTEYSEWKENGFTKVEKILAWKSQKFTPQEAAEWVKGGFSPSQAVENRSKGLQPVK
ncbi:MAG: hypothetical protein NE330_19980 [Lentisphaeraceae bacterium]|nr:hypothetical protein [Lentisphaeraceae bacterium]